MTRVLAIFTAAATALALTSVGASAQEGTSTMGHARARALAGRGLLPEPGDIVVEDLINYHRHALAPPRAGEAVALDLRWGDAGLGPRGAAVLQIGLATPRVHDRRHLRALNLALVIDCSGSMGDRDKMSRVKQGLRRLLAELRPADRVAVVTYSSGAALALESSAVGEGGALRRVIAGLRPGGSTNLHAGLMLGYRQVAAGYLVDGTNRVILLTDGIANAGVVDPDAIARESSRFNREGIDLSTIGVGLDINKDLLGRLSRAGRGLFHFVADARDIEKVFVEEVQSLIAPIARAARLEITCPRGVRIERIFGYHPRFEGRRVALDLDDLNYGLTQVVLAEVRFASAGADAAARPLEVRLSYEDAASARRCHLVQQAWLERGQERSGAPLRDYEVRKNYTIAVMAQAMEEMARACKSGRLDRAERIVQRALALAKARFPTIEDRDLARIYKMLVEYRRTLRARIECFRDL